MRRRPTCLSERSSWRPAITAGVACALLMPLMSFGQATPSSAVDQVRLVQRLGEPIDLGLWFTDEGGQAVTLRDYFHERPVVLVPVVYRCTMLCTQVLNALMRTSGGLDFAPGKDFEIVAFTLDPRETSTLAGQKKLNYLRHEDDAGARRGWHFLTGEAASITKLTDAIGYGYAYDATTDQFAHPAAIVLLTPDGRISRYVIGLDYEVRDLRLSLVEAGEGTIGSLVDRVVLRCYAYDPARGRYGLAIMGSLRAGAAVTVVGLIVMIAWLERRRRRSVVSRALAPMGERRTSAVCEDKH